MSNVCATPDADWSKDLHLAIARGWLESLASGPHGACPDRFFAAIRLMLEEAGVEDSVHAWVEGDLSIEMRRAKAGGVLVEAVTTAGGRRASAFFVSFPRLSFARALALIEERPSLLAPGFVLADVDIITASVVRTLGEEDVAPFLEEEATPRTSGIVFITGEVTGYDPEATIIAAPPLDLLLASLTEAKRSAAG